MFDDNKKKSDQSWKNGSGKITKTHTPAHMHTRTSDCPNASARGLTLCALVSSSLSRSYPFSRTSMTDGLPEEKECLQFFEETIGSLENSLEEDGLRAGLVKSPASASHLLGHEMDGPPETPDLYRVHPINARRLSAKDQDIIDLVRPDPDMIHFEIKPRHDPLHHSAGYELTDSHSYHPAGSVPTPVLIAKKIAENQAVGTPNTLASLQRRHSQEDVKSLGLDGVPPAKQGPPTLAKPTRYPANISMVIGNRELQNQPGSNVNLHDRRALMLSNLTGAPQGLLQEDSKPILVQKLRKAPSRSASFKDPTPEKTRMEALSKLGLARNCDLSGEIDLPDILSSHIDVNQNVPVKPQALPAKLNSYGGKSRTINPSVGVQRPPDSPGRALKGPPPTPAPRNPQTSHPNAGKAAVPDAKQRAAAPMFRPQGITVQFSGRGATEESRKQALKKLGLLKES
uniref:Proline and serine rich 2 n=1 Tax=Hippocampus comes TaxID=109280 RepID=A0A3Q2XRK9_HIPCM